MGKEDFRQALSDFTFDMASGGAIRHLTDLGYTVKQIQEQLDFPTPIARIQEGVWKRLAETGVIFLEEPWRQKSREIVNYVREYDSYGKASFRRVVEKIRSRRQQGLSWSVSLDCCSTVTGRNTGRCLGRLTRDRLSISTDCPGR